jgi:hypothetical protein
MQATGLLVLTLAIAPGCEVTHRYAEMRSIEDQVQFYGRIIDQYDQPVDRATVTIAVDTVHIIPRTPPTLQLKTDSNGRFSIEKGKNGITAAGISIRSIEREGYEMKFQQGERHGFDYRKSNPNRYLPNQDLPFTYRMRKKNATSTFVFEEVDLRFQFGVEESGRRIGYDFVQRGHVRNVGKPTGDDRERVVDLQVTASYNSNDQTWTAVLSAGSAKGGIIVTEQLLYEAPDHGYQDEYVFTPEDRKPVKARYVYLKSRDPAIYTRVEIEYVNASSDFLRLMCGSVTNPYGDRNLEQATHLPYEVVRQLTDEARTAFRQNKRPTKPNLANDSHEH